MDTTPHCPSSLASDKLANRAGEATQPPYVWGRSPLGATTPDVRPASATRQDQLPATVKLWKCNISGREHGPTDVVSSSLAVLQIKNANGHVSQLKNRHPCAHTSVIYLYGNMSYMYNITQTSCNIVINFKAEIRRHLSTVIFLLQLNIYVLYRYITDDNSKNACGTLILETS